MNTKTIGSIVIALVVGFGAGYVVHSSPTQTQNAQGNFAGRTDGNGMMRGAGTAGGGFLSGTVAKQDSGSITINTRDGSSHIVLISPATSVDKSVKGSLNDISTGANIIVSGTTNSDGSVSATLIQIRPAPPTGTTN